MVAASQSKSPAAGLGTSRLLRVLCLHGYAQNAEIFRAKTGALRKHLKGFCEFEFFDAPHLATASFANAPTADEEGDSRGAPRAWWNPAADEPEGTRPSQSRSYAGWAESQAHIERAMIERGPFDGVLGFSQGAAAAAVVLASSQGASALRFAIIVSGFVPKDEAVSGPLCSTLHRGVQTMHVCGSTDAFIAVSASEALASNFEDALIFRHEGGHAVPSSALFRAATRELIAPHFAEINRRDPGPQGDAQ